MVGEPIHEAKHLNVNNLSKSETWFKTEVIEILANIKTTFYITSYENKKCWSMDVVQAFT
jgi:hypothetical protein